MKKMLKMVCCNYMLLLITWSANNNNNNNSKTTIYNSELRIVFLRSNRITNRIGRPIRFESNRPYIPRKP